MSDRQGSDRVSRFRDQNQNTIQELAGCILDNLSANLSEAAIVTRGRRGRGSTRRGAHRSGSARTTPRPGLCRSASSGCSCGPVCSSRAASSSALNPEASAFVPRFRSPRGSSRNVARRSKPRRVSFGSARPVHHLREEGFVEPRSDSPPLYPPSYYQAVGEGE